MNRRRLLTFGVVCGALLLGALGLLFVLPGNPNKVAFLKVRKAADAKTWSAANKILATIDEKSIDDPDVVTYADIANRCARLADKLGVDRNADPGSVGSVMSSLNFEKVMTEMISILINQGPLEAAKMLGEARQIQREIPTFQSLDVQLAKKYGGH